MREYLKKQEKFHYDSNCKLFSPASYFIKDRILGGVMGD